MSILSWLKENVFDWDGLYREMYYGGRRPPEHPPGQRANNALKGQAGTRRTKRTSNKPARRSR